MSSNYSIREFGRMIEDEARMSAYVGALQRAVTPGCTVLDIGAGTGIFSFLAAQAGAARIYAVETLDAIEVARRSASRVPGAERITWIQGLSTELELPERVDVVIGDLHGMLPFYSGNLRSMFDARLRHLKPGGRIIPGKDRLWAAPLQSKVQASELERPWRQNAYGLDLSESRPYVANQLSRLRSSTVAAADLLAPPACWGEIDYALTESTALENSLAWTVACDGVLHGFHVWFDTETDEGLVISNAPGLPDKVYGSAFFPAEESVPVIVGDQVTLDLSARELRGNYVFRWDTVVRNAAGEVKARFRQSTFKAQVLARDRLEAAAAARPAPLNEQGAVLQLLLQALDRGESVQRMADALLQRFPDRYDSLGQALAEATRAAADYT